MCAITTPIAIEKLFWIPTTQPNYYTIKLLHNQTSLLFSILVHKLKLEELRGHKTVTVVSHMSDIFLLMVFTLCKPYIFQTQNI